MIHRILARRAILAGLLLIASCGPAGPPTGAILPSPSAPPTPSPTSSPGPTVRPTSTRVPVTFDPTKPFSCIERIAVPDIADVTGLAWSPDGNTIVVSHTVALPSARITGSTEDFFLDALDLRTGELTPLGLGERPEWSPSGKYLAYWSFDGDLRVAIGGRVIELPRATIPETRWVGDTLYFFVKDEIRAWSESGTRVVAKLPEGLEPHYPADDGAFSADGQRFTITRYSQDGTIRRYLGVTASGEAVPLPGAATYLEWAPSGATLLIRSPENVSLRDADGTVRDAALSRFPGAVHGWLPDGRTPFLGPVTAAVPGQLRFDTARTWRADGTAANVTLPNLVGPRRFGPDGSTFAGESRTGLRTTRLELFRCANVDRSGAPMTVTLAAAVDPADARRFLRPVVGVLTQLFTPSHPGIDVAAPLGSLIVAADDGVVNAVGWVAVGGHRVCMLHLGNLETCYYHTSAALVTIGDRVARGQPIALIGLTGVTTGPHVHWEAKQADRLVDPLNR